MRRLLVLLPFFFLLACKPSLLPNSSVPNTYENRAVMAFLDQYTSATTARSVDGIMALVADDFFDQGSGEKNSKDMYGYAQLKKKLTSTFSKIESIHLRIHVQKIERKDNLFDVYYYFVQRALINYPIESQWVNVSDTNRMVIRTKGPKLEDGFEIISGL